MAHLSVRQPKAVFVSTMLMLLSIGHRDASSFGVKFMNFSIVAS
jgi:hypothetical protein